MAKLINMIGKKFGKLKVIKRVENKGDSVVYLCQCDCGNTKMTDGTSLRRGLSKSCGCGRRLLYGEGSFRALYRYTKYNAQYRNIEWDIDLEFFRWITKQPCHYCGAEPSQVYYPKKVKHYGEYIYNGIDRVDNNLGYIPDNCVPCCGYCNWMKSAAPVEEFRKWVIQVNNHWASK